jgi:hypothetical protein
VTDVKHSVSQLEDEKQFFWLEVHVAFWVLWSGVDLYSMSSYKFNNNIIKLSNNFIGSSANLIDAIQAMI